MILMNTKVEEHWSVLPSAQDSLPTGEAKILENDLGQVSFQLRF
jgi:hypothetical protein